MAETSDAEGEYAWMDASLKAVPALHEFRCESCGCQSLYMAWCQQHGMKSCPVYKKDKKPPKTCGMLACMFQAGEMTP